MPEIKIPIRTHGLLVKVFLRRPSDHAVHPSALLAFLDTGASDTMVDLGVIESLDLAPCHQVGLNLLGRSAPSFHDTFEVEIALADGPERWLPLTILGGPCFQTGAAAALGRDFLKHFRVAYDGLARKASIAW